MLDSDSVAAATCCTANGIVSTVPVASVSSADMLLKSARNGAEALVKREGRVVVQNFDDGFSLICSAFGGLCGLEMIVNDVGGNYFQESVNGIFLVRLEGAKQAIVVFAELQVSILDEIVEVGASWFAPHAGGPEDGGRDDSLETLNELEPCALVFRVRANAD